MSPDYDATDAIVSIDFASLFPHVFWVSSWAADDQYPDGFRYKLLSVRPEPEGHIQLVVVLEQTDGSKHELSRLDISPSAFCRTANTFVEGLSEAYGIAFTPIDLSSVVDQSEFERRVIAAGWLQTSVQ